MPSTIPVNAADMTTQQEDETPFGPDDLLKEAEVYDQHADQIEAEVMQYHRTAASYNSSIHGPKGYSAGGLADRGIFEGQSCGRAATACRAPSDGGKADVGHAVPH